MATTKTQAAKLLTAAEMELFLAGQPTAIKDFSAARLAGKVKRARTLRDKYRDLLKRQKVAAQARTRSKTGTSGNANERTATKAQVFDELLQRFTARLDKVSADAARVAARAEAAKAKAKKAADKAAAKKAATKKPAAKKPVAKKAAAKKAAPKAATAPKKAAAKKVAVKKAVAQALKAPATGRPAAPKRSAKAPAQAPGAAGGGVGAGSKRAKAEAKSSKLTAARTRPIQAHIASTDRRNQAKRDRRG